MDRTIWILFCAVSCLVCVIAYEDTIGDAFQTKQTKTSNAGGVYIFENYVFPRSVVFRFSAYIVAIAPVWFQVWRPNKDKKEYQLVGQIRFVPQEFPRIYSVTLRTIDELIFTEEGDVLGIWNELSQSPLAYEFVPGMSNTNVYRYFVDRVSDMYPGTVITVDDFPHPEKFSVSAEFDTDVDKYLSGWTGTLIPPTIPPSPRTSIPPIPPNDGTIIYSGHSLDSSSNSVMTSSARGIYLLHDIKFRRGVVVSFFGYFVRSEPIWFQVWRWRSEDWYMLVGQARFDVAMVPGVREFVLRPDQYIHTQDNDMLGIMIEGDIGPVGYRFITDQSQARPFAAPLEDIMPSRGYNTRFLDIVMPYHFAIGTKYDTDPNPDVYGTPPPFSVTRPSTVPTTTTKGTTVPDIAADLIIGKDNIRHTSSYLATGSRRTFLLEELVFLHSGQVTSFLGYFLNSGRIQFQVWRKVAGSQTDYMLVCYKDYFISSAIGYFEIDLAPSEQCEIEAGDCLGFANGEEQSIVGYHFETTSLLFNDDVFQNRINDTVTFDSLPMPYKMAIAATYRLKSPQATTGQVSPTPSKGGSTNQGTRSTSKPQSSSVSSTNPTTTTTTTTPTTTTTATTTTTEETTPSVSTARTPVSGSTSQMSSSTKVTSPSSKVMSPQSSMTSSSTKVTSPSSNVTSPLSSMTSSNTKVTSPSSNVTSPPIIVTSSIASSTKKTPPTRPSSADPGSTSPITAESTVKNQKSTAPPANRPTPATGGSTGNKESQYGWLLDPTVLLALFIWLIILTVLFLILCLVVIIRTRKRSERGYYRRKPYSFTNPATSSRPNSYNAWGSMKNDEVIDYFNPSVGRSPSRGQNGENSNGSFSKSSPQSPLFADNGPGSPQKWSDGLTHM